MDQESLTFILRICICWSRITDIYIENSHLLIKNHLHLYGEFASWSRMAYIFMENLHLLIKNHLHFNEELAPVDQETIQWLHICPYMTGVSIYTSVSGLVRFNCHVVFQTLWYLLYTSSLYFWKWLKIDIKKVWFALLTGC